MVNHLHNTLQPDYYAEQDLAKPHIWGSYQEYDLHNTLILGYRLTKICITL